MTFEKVGVAGSGTMGSGIAEVAARAGLDVVLRGRSQASADAALGKVARSVAAQVEKGKLSEDEAQSLVGRVRTTTELEDLSGCDIVVESVVEDLDVKKALFADLDRVCAESAILATNTSTLPITEIANGTRQPERVVGLHFFNPAPKMPLVEVVPAETTADETVEGARRFAEACGKSAVTVKDSAGFVVNALLLPYLNSAVRLLEARVASKEDIDAAMKGGCGFPMGPLELLDLIGLDTSLAILRTLHAQGDGCAAPAPMLEELVAEGHLGRKSGAGFYEYGSKR
jgi:3-hydroxybutyryl-CoA dehydrogenase